MERRRRNALIIILIICAVLLGFTVQYLIGFFSSITEKIPTSASFDANVSNTFIDANGEVTLMRKGDVASVRVNASDYSFKLYDINDTKASFSVNNFLFFQLKPYEIKKIDLDGDYIYDILLQINAYDGSQVEVVFDRIKELKSAKGDLSQIADRINSKSEIQSNVMILTALVFMLILLVYITRIFVIPKIEEKKKLARKSELEAFYDLYDAFDRYKQVGNIDKAKKVFDKAKHLYGYLSSDDKADAKSSFDEMVKYLK